MIRHGLDVCELTNEKPFEVATVDEVKGRMTRLRADSARAWGKMNAAQMLADCSAALEMAEQFAGLM